MKNLIIGIVATGLAVAGGWYYISHTEKLTAKEVFVTPTSQGPFRYFQITALIEPGVAGDISVNGEKLIIFGKKGGQFNKNDIQELINDGNNSIELNISSADAKDVTDALLSYTVEIELHALNEPGVSTKANEVLNIKWNQVPTGGPDNVIYSFFIKRDESKPIQSSNAIDSNVVTNSDKASFVAALNKRKDLFASKDAKTIRAFYVKILPADSGVAKKNDSQILAMAERDLAKLSQISSSVFESASVQWTKSISDVQAIISYNGEEMAFSTKVIGGVQY